MEPEGDSHRGAGFQWRNYKLLLDPALPGIRSSQKIYRYDGVHFNITDGPFLPLGDVRDPRSQPLWSKPREVTLPVPKFKYDKFYIGQLPQKEVTFAHLNDNIREPFLTDMCHKFGHVEEVEILLHPETRKHLGLAKVLFISSRAAKETVAQLHNTSVMGNIVHAELDLLGQQRKKYYDLIVSGTYSAQTVPTTGRWAQERLPSEQVENRRHVTSDSSFLPGNGTPSSQDSGSLYSQYTPSLSSSQGTPYTPRSGTPYSQDSAYSSRQGTPSHSTSHDASGYKSRRQENSSGDSYSRRSGHHYSSSASSSSSQADSGHRRYHRHQHRTSSQSYRSRHRKPPPPPEEPPLHRFPGTPPLPTPPPPLPPDEPQTDWDYRLHPPLPPSPPSSSLLQPPPPPTESWEPPPPPPPLPACSPPPSPARSCSPLPDGISESLPFTQHSSSLDSRIEALLKEQRSKFSFLPSDTEEEDEGTADGAVQELAAAAAAAVHEEVPPPIHGPYTPPPPASFEDVSAEAYLRFGDIARTANGQERRLHGKARYRRQSQRSHLGTFWDRTY